MTLHLKKINDFGGKNGGGGGDVVVTKRQIPVIWNSTEIQRWSNFTMRLRVFNKDTSKVVRTTPGQYGSSLCVIYNLTSTGGTSISNISSSYIASADYMRNMRIAKDDSFLVYYYSTNNIFGYVPVSSSYTAGTSIVTNLPSATYLCPTIINNTRFAILDDSNHNVLILKLEGGAITQEKTISATADVVGIGVFAEKLVLVIDGSAEKGIRIIDVDTEELLYEDIRTDGTNSINRYIEEKDNYLFVPCTHNATPYVTTPLMIYEYSNGQFSKKNVTISNFEIKSTSVNLPVTVHKAEENKYFVASTHSYSCRERQILVCDLSNNTIEETFYVDDSNFSTSSPSIIDIATIDNKITPIKTISAGSAPSVAYEFRGEISLDKTPTQIQYQGNIFGLTELGE